MRESAVRCRRGSRPGFPRAVPRRRPGARRLVPGCPIPGRYLAEALSASPFHYALVAGLAPVGAAAVRLAAPGPETRDSETVALASCRLIDEGAAELGILIEDAWQRRGLGTRLLSDLVAYASGMGLRVLEAQLLAEQAWIAGLLRPHGTCSVRPAWGGVLHVTVRLGEASA